MSDPKHGYVDDGPGFTHPDGKRCVPTTKRRWLEEGKGLDALCLRSHVTDPVNHPDHYRWLPVEVIEITEHFNFRMGNALKYIMRADHKGKPVEDLKKAVWYLQREIDSRLASGDSV